MVRLHSTVLSRRPTNVILPVELPALLPAINGADIADLGCGAGALCRRLAKEGANVWDYDPSDKMLDVARSETEKDLRIRYECVAIEQKPCESKV